MWTCVSCGEVADDNFTECWNCLADRDGLVAEGQLLTHEHIAAENRAIAPEKPGLINCMRCGDILEHKGMMQFGHSPLWLTGAFNVLDKHLEMYSCPRCGHVEFFMS